MERLAKPKKQKAVKAPETKEEKLAVIVDLQKKMDKELTELSKYTSGILLPLEKQLKEARETVIKARDEKYEEINNLVFESLSAIDQRIHGKRVIWKRADHCESGPTMLIQFKVDVNNNTELYASVAPARSLGSRGYKQIGSPKDMLITSLISDYEIVEAK